MKLNTEDINMYYNWVYPTIQKYYSLLDSISIDVLSDLQFISLYNVYADTINRIISASKIYDFTKISKKPIIFNKDKIYGYVNINNKDYKIVLVNNKDYLDIEELDKEDVDELLNTNTFNKVSNEEWDKVVSTITNIYNLYKTVKGNNGNTDKLPNAQIASKYVGKTKDDEENTLNGLIVSYIIDNKDSYTVNKEFLNSDINFTYLLNLLEESIELENDIDNDIDNMSNVISNNDEVTDEMILDIKSKLNRYSSMLGNDTSISNEGFDKFLNRDTYRELFNNLKSFKHNLNKISYIVSDRIKSFSLKFREALDTSFRKDLDSAIKLKSKLESIDVDSLDNSSFTKRFDKYSGDSYFYNNGRNDVIEDMIDNMFNYLSNIKDHDFNSTSGYNVLDYNLKNQVDNGMLISLTVNKQKVVGYYLVQGEDYINIISKSSNNITDFKSDFKFNKDTAIRLLDSIVEYAKLYYKFRDKHNSIIKNVSNIKSIPEEIDYVKFYRAYTKNHGMLLKVIYNQFKEFNKYALIYSSCYVKAVENLNIEG